MSPANDIGPYTKKRAHACRDGRAMTTRTACTLNVKLISSISNASNASNGEIPLDSTLPSEGTMSPRTVVATTQSRR